MTEENYISNNKVNNYLNNRTKQRSCCRDVERRTSCPGPRIPELGGGLMTTTEDDVTDRKKKTKHPRRSLRRYLTADSALQSPYDPQAIQVWTSSLMAEFNHIIDGELKRLGQQVASSTERSLSPWARMQLAIIDPAPAPSIQQLSDDIDLVERQIFDDLDDLQQLNQSQLSSSTASEPNEHLSSPVLVIYFYYTF